MIFGSELEFDESLVKSQSLVQKDSKFSQSLA